MQTSKVVLIGAGVKPKLRPRGKPFKKGHRQPFQFQPGQSGNPGGKPKLHQRLSAEYAARLLETVPSAVAAVLGIPQGSNWAEAIAAAIISRAANGDIRAAKEVREATEGKVFGKLEHDGSLQPPSLVFNFATAANDGGREAS